MPRSCKGLLFPPEYVLALFKGDERYSRILLTRDRQSVSYFALLSELSALREPILSRIPYEAPSVFFGGYTVITLCNESYGLLVK